MMRYLFVLIAAITGLETCAQILDTSLYSSLFEQEVFMHYYDDKQSVDSLDLLLVIDCNREEAGTIRNKINDIYKALEDKNIRGKSLKKQIKLIYKYIHSEYLFKYDIETTISETINIGEYNCVSATALYALIFDHFHIKYIIYEQPEHVYIVADPGNLHVIVESTMPNGGVMVYREEAKRDFVRYLADNKIISQDEFLANSTEKLFNKYYYQNENEIDLTSLVAFQYYNRGLKLYDKEDYEQAMGLFKKAQQLYSGININYMLNSCYAQLLNKDLTSKNFNGRNLAEYLNHNIDNDEVKINTLENFRFITNELVINHPDITAYQTFYNDFMRHIDSTIVLNEYEQSYYQNLGYYFYANGKNAIALEKLHIAFILNEENLQSRQLIHDISMKHLYTENFVKGLIDSLEYYFSIFPFLLEYKDFQMYYTYAYAKIVFNLYLDEKITEGREYLDRLDQVLTDNPEIEIPEATYITTYSLVAAYHVQNQEYKTAISILNRGLKYVPDSKKLNSQKQSIIDFRKDLSNLNYYTGGEIKHLIKESFEKEFGEYIKGSWKVLYKDEIIDKNKPDYKSLDLEVETSKKVFYKINSKKLKGTYALRPKSKLFYLIPDNDSSNYMVFQVIHLSEDEIELRPLNNGYGTDYFYLIRAN